jgi:hypothetical protein
MGYGVTQWRLKLTSFDTQYERYETWFTRHEAAYHSELLAVRALLPWQGLGLEIGFVDRASELGRHYLNHQAENVFYREARFRVYKSNTITPGIG